MKENEKTELVSSNKKKAYVSPKVDVMYVELEYGIASGSATALPSDTNSGIHTWENADVTPGSNDSPIYW